MGAIVLGRDAADASALEPPLCEVLSKSVNPVARRITEMALQALADVRESATRAVELLELIESDGT